jgi:hypothetical protein
MKNRSHGRTAGRGVPGQAYTEKAAQNHREKQIRHRLLRKRLGALGGATSHV